MPGAGWGASGCQPLWLLRMDSREVGVAADLDPAREGRLSSGCRSPVLPTSLLLASPSVLGERPVLSRRSCCRVGVQRLGLLLTAWAH